MTLRIAHVISTPEGVGGAERVLACLANAAGARGHEVLVLNPFARAPSEAGLRSLLHDDSVYSGRTGDRLIQLPGLRAWLRDELSRFGPDVVHGHLFHACAILATLGRDSRVLRVLTHHHGSVLQQRGRRSLAVLDRLATSRFDHVIAVSGSVERFVIRRYGIDPRNVTCIQNGWDGEPQPLPRDERRTTVICTANFRPEKDHSTLIAAFADVIREVPSAHLELLGDGPLKADLIHQVDRAGLARHVTFVGTVTDVWPHLGRAAVFVLPSAYEPLGIAVMEAMASGLPVVATDVGGVSELIEHESTGLLVGPKDKYALSEALVRLLRSGTDRAKLGDAAQREAASTRVDRMVDGYFDLYEKLSGGRFHRHSE